MPGDFTNDNNPAFLVASEPDAHGHAAILLVESLLHGLIEQSILTVDQAVDIVDVAAEVNRDVGVDRGQSPANLQRSIVVLEAISRSLRQDTIAK